LWTLDADTLVQSKLTHSFRTHYMTAEGEVMPKGILLLMVTVFPFLALAGEHLEEQKKAYEKAKILSEEDIKPALVKSSWAGECIYDGLQGKDIRKGQLLSIYQQKVAGGKTRIFFDPAFYPDPDSAKADLVTDAERIRLNWLHDFQLEKEASKESSWLEKPRKSTLQPRIGYWPLNYNEEKTSRANYYFVSPGWALPSGPGYLTIPYVWYATIGATGFGRHGGIHGLSMAQYDIALKQSEKEGKRLLHVRLTCSNHACIFGRETHPEGRVKKDHPFAFCTLDKSRLLPQ
jgi:hypothetical protein